MNSTPQLLARDRRAVAQGAQLGSGDLRMDAAAQAAVGAGDDVLLVRSRFFGVKNARLSGLTDAFYVNLRRQINDLPWSDPQPGWVISRPRLAWGR